jgi:hypothetical protein
MQRAQSFFLIAAPAIENDKYNDQKKYLFFLSFIFFTTEAQRAQSFLLCFPLSFSNHMAKFKDINDLTGAVIGAAIEVHRVLGPGLLEFYPVK